VILGFVHGMIGKCACFIGKRALCIGNCVFEAIGLCWGIPIFCESGSIAKCARLIGKRSFL